MATDHNFRIKNGLEVGGQLIVTSSGQLAVASVSSQLQFLDNVKAKFGNGSDLQIYHTGTESWIKDAGTGNLYIDSNGAAIQLTSGNAAKSMINAVPDGGVTLFHNNNIKLNTSSSGVDVTGTLVSDGLSVASDTDTISTLGRAKIGAFVTDYAYFSHIDNATSSNYALNQNSTGATSVNAKAGTSLGLKINNVNALTVASNSNIGINETTPLAKLEVAGAIKATSRDTSHTSEAGLTIAYDTTNSIGLIETWTSKPLLTRTYNYQAFDISGTEMMRINSTGVGIGTNNPGEVLTVEGGAEAIGLNLTGSGERLTIGSDGTYNYFRAKSGNQFKFTTTGGSDLLLNNSGVLTLSAGTSNRTVQLQDNGLYISRTTDGANTSQIIADTNNGNDLAIKVRSALKLYHNSAHKYTFSEIGFGVNKTTPDFALCLSHNANSGGSNSGVMLSFDPSTATDPSGYRFKSQVVGGSTGYYQVLYDGAEIAWKNFSSSAYTPRMRLSNAGNLAIGNSVDTTRLRVTGSTNDSSADALKVEDSTGQDLFRVINDGRVLIQDNYLYVNNSAGAYFDGSIKARGGINNDQGTLLLNDDVNVTGQLQVWNGSSTNRIRLYTEVATAQIADTFSDTTTQKSYIYFDAGLSSNDPGYIMHETSNTETNEGVLHLVPSDDNDASDYVSIHGTNDPDCLRLRTNGKIETAGSYQLTLLSGSGDVLVDDGLTVSNNLTVTGDLVVNGSTTTFNTATLDVEDKNITLNYGSGDTSATAGGAGITIQDAVNSTTDATILWDATNDEFDFSHAINVTGNITVSGTVDGRDIATDGSKLDNIEANATADQTASEILTAIKTVDGSGSGLDADLLDNQQGSYYLDANNLTGTINNNRLASSVVITDGGTYATGFSGDLNSITGWRIHRVTGYSGSTDNRAFTSHHNLLTMPNTSSAGPYSVQIAAETDSSPDMKFRASYGSTSSWSSWNKIWTDNNDGSGSGLDADTLDGQQGSYYLNYNNFTNTPTIPTNNNQLTNGAGYITGNQTITLSGDVSGSGTTSISVTIADDSHNHIISNVDGLQTSLDAKVAKSGDTMTGTLNVPTVRNGTSGALLLGAFTTANADQWPYVTWLRDTANSWDEGLIKGSSSRGVFGRQHFGIHFDDDRSFAFHTSSWDTEMEISGDGRIYQKGPVGINTTPTSGGASLQVSGNADISGTISSSTIHNTGVIYLGSTSTANDQFASNNGTDIFIGTTAKGLRTYKDLHTNSGNNKYWHAGNDGSGSGLDADTLDGIQGASFLRSDANDTATGNLTFSSNNNEYSGHHYFLAYDSNGNHYPHYTSGSGNNGAQVNLRVQQSGGSGYDVLYIENGNNNITWRGNKIWNAANDGGGSGLDADTVDGIQANSFLRSDTADTATGTITFSAGINLNNTNITNVNAIQIGDPGPNEGVSWSNIKIYESPDDLTTNSAGNFQVVYGSTRRFTVNSTGADVNGALTATTKSFDIEHPTKEGMRLHHGVLEGPEHAVYIRGKSNSYIIELPDYWEGLVHEDTITVQLTPIGGQNDMWIENIEDNKVYINCEKEMKQYFYFIQAERKDIERFEVEYGNSV